MEFPLLFRRGIAKPLPGPLGNVTARVPPPPLHKTPSFADLGMRVVAVLTCMIIMITFRLVLAWPNKPIGFMPVSFAAPKDGAPVSNCTQVFVTGPRCQRRGESGS